MKKNSAAVAEKTWIEECVGILDLVRRDLENTTKDFQEYAEKYTLLGAIEWRSAALAGAQARWGTVAGMYAYLTTPHENGPSEEEMATTVLQEIARLRRSFFDCFRVAASTSAFANAIENARLEGYAKLFDSFGGPLHQIEILITGRAK